MRRHVVAAARRDQVFLMLGRAHDALVGGDLRGVEIELEAALGAASLIAIGGGKEKRRSMMPYRGKRIGVVLGADVRRLTDAERARTSRAQRYRVVGHLQWCPGWFFAGRLGASEQELAVMRAAAHMIAGDAEELAEAERSTGPSIEDTVGWGEWTNEDEPCGEWPAWATAIVAREADPS